MVERGGFAGLDPCVHCGFCLQACPTFLATGDEADSPRGRIELMRALERGDLLTTDAELVTHLDRCLGCRACEPVCPSGVLYGQGLEAARDRLTRDRGVPWLARLVLALLTTVGLSRAVYGLARLLRATGLPARFAGRNRAGFALGMLAATAPDRGIGRLAVSRQSSAASAQPPHRLTASLFRGCVMDGLFGHVHDATIRTLSVNGCEVGEVAGQGCCGALHAHAGLRSAAQALARTNVAAFGDGDEAIVVNSAGCGAQLKAYGELLEGDAAAQRFAARVRDVTELLAARGPAAGAPLDLRVAYDPPCHLLHAQRIADPPLALFAAIPVLRLLSVPGAEQCCGSAGLFTLAQPAMSQMVLGPKIEQLRTAAPDVVATGNPGCVMQLGAGLRAAGLRTAIRHPVELLDESYRAAGLYG